MDYGGGRPPTGASSSLLLFEREMRDLGEIELGAGASLEHIQHVLERKLARLSSRRKGTHFNWSVQ